MYIYRLFISTTTRISTAPPLQISPPPTPLTPEKKGGSVLGMIYTRRIVYFK